MREHGTLHIPDWRRAERFPDGGFRQRAGELVWLFRFVSRENSSEELIARRIEVRPFTPAQIKLLETFADQAVIAIENVRLFKELQERNRIARGAGASDGDERGAEHHRRSPTDVQPVLDAIVESAANGLWDR